MIRFCKFSVVNVIITLQNTLKRYFATELKLSKVVMVLQEVLFAVSFKSGE